MKLASPISNLKQQLPTRSQKVRLIPQNRLIYISRIAPLTRYILAKFNFLILSSTFCGVMRSICAPHLLQLELCLEFVSI